MIIQTIVAGVTTTKASSERLHGRSHWPRLFAAEVGILCKCMRRIVKKADTFYKGLTMKQQTPHRLLTGYLYLLMFAYACSVTMLGPLMPRLISDFTLRLSEGGFIVSAQSIGGILSIIAGGVIADRVRKGRLIGYMFFIYSAALLIVGFISTYLVLLVVFFFLGASTRLLDAVLNAHVADIHPEKKGVHLNLLHTFFGVGALLGPLYATYLLHRLDDWHQAFLILGAVCLVIFAIYVPVHRKTDRDLPQRSVPAKGSYINLLKSRDMWLLSLIMFMYAGHQTGLIIWLPMYMETHLSTGPWLAGSSLSVLWIGIIISRILASRLSERFTPVQLILWGNFIGFVLLLAGFLIGRPILLLASVGVTGVVTGAVIPLLIAASCDRFPQNTGTASSLIFLNGNIARMLFPWLIGLVAELFSFQGGILITVGCMGLVVISSAVMRAKARNS